MKPIQEFSDEDLIEELMERYDHIVIGSRRDLTSSENPKAQRRRWWKGDTEICIGLAHSVAQDLVNKTWGIDQDDIKC
jgi:hypothetical protein